MQNEVFTKWKNVNYLGQTPGKEFPFMKTLYVNDNDKFLISKEALTNPSRFKSDQEKEQIVKNLSKMFPNAKIIVSFRKHYSFITSLYKESLHQGSIYYSINDFLDPENNKGALDLKNINFQIYIDLIRKYFHQEPFVYLHEELIYNFDNLLSDMEGFVGGEAPKITDIDFNKSNKGIGSYQAVLLREASKIVPGKSTPNSVLSFNKYTYFLHRQIRDLCQNKLSFLANKPIKMTKKQKKLTSEYYKKDWEYILDYIQNRCPYRKNFDSFKYR